MPLNVVDIYCGAGGLSAGMQHASLTVREGEIEAFHVVYGFDKDRDAIATYRKNHFGDLSLDQQETLAPCRDVAGLTGEHIRAVAGIDHIDVVVGGPNCQGVSGAGLRNPQDDRNRMFPEFLRLVSELRPSWFVMENVPGLTHENNRELLRDIMAQFAQLSDYQVAADVLLAADFGSPQLRYRLFVIGTNTGHPIRFPLPTHSPVAPGPQRELFAALPPYTTVGDALRDLEHVRPWTGEDRQIEREDGRIVYNHIVFELEEENRRRIASVPEGRDWRSLPISLLPQRYFATRASDQKGAYGRLAWDQPAFTITASTGNVSAGPFTHPSQDRPISVREAARLQGFGDDYVFCGEADSMYRQVGNAVPPPLAHAVAHMVLCCHFAPDQAQRVGRQGRITLALLEDWCSGMRKSFPVLTPRFPSQRPLRRGVPQTRPSATKATGNAPRFVEEASHRTTLSPKLLALLENEAAQPGNVKAAKRARVMLAYLAGASLADLCTQAKVSEKSIRKWVDGFYTRGMDGWRAHHTGLATLAGDDAELLRKLTAAVGRVRAHTVGYPAQSHKDAVAVTNDAVSTNGDDGSTPRRRVSERPHMNHYLRKLALRYAQYSVEELTACVEMRLGKPIGTQYVGDLLAVADVVIGKDIAALSASHADCSASSTAASGEAAS